MADQKISARDLLTGTGVVSTPAVRAGSTTDYRIVDNLSATTDPGVGDDSADGFHVGSRWFNTSAGRVWMCTDASAGAAVWKRQMVVDDNLAGVTAATARSTLGVNKRRPGTGDLYRSGVDYSFPNIGAGASGTASAINRIHFIPFMLYDAASISGMYLRISAGQASANSQLAIYANNDTTMRPTGSALGSTGNIDSSVTNTTSYAAFSGGNVSILEGSLYWAAFNTNNGAVTFPVVNQSNDSFAASVIGDSAANILPAGNSINQGYYTAQTFNTWPDVTASSFTPLGTGNVPFMGFRAA